MTKAQKLDQRMRNNRKAADEASQQTEARKIVALYDAGELNWPAALIDQIRAVIA